MDDDFRAVLVQYPPEELLDYPISALIDVDAHVMFYLPCSFSSGGDGIGNPRPDDPMTIYWVSDTTEDDERVAYKTTLASLISEAFDMHQMRHVAEEVIGESSVPTFVSMRDALQKEIDRINFWVDNAIPDDVDVLGEHDG
jgi:hypothetical protein